MRPKLLLLDEPVAGMNREETEDMARFILDVRREWGVTVLMVEHDMGMVMDSPTTSSCSISGRSSPAAGRPRCRPTRR
jgi:ABC-type branched-subunit amino acid transport system ATPase component